MTPTPARADRGTTSAHRSFRIIHLYTDAHIHL
uniref:Uncharacterized protein n=1 Tax=Anguilla anguilla TaxID=7936 RepID=A0A0E9QYK2_ANGAN